MEKTNEKIKFIDQSSIPFIVGTALIIGIVLGGIIVNFLKPSYTKISNISQNDSSSFSLNSNNINSDYFNNVYQLIQSKFIGTIPDKAALTYGSLKGLLASLGNQYNSFLTPEEAKVYLDNRDPKFGGIGVTLKSDGQNTLVETAISGYSAEKAGLLPGDVISQINSQNVLGKLPKDVAVLIRGVKGTTVNIQVLRVNGSKQSTLSFAIVRETIQIQNITYQDLGNGIIKINIVQFLDSSPEVFNSNWDKIVSQIKASGKPIKGIVMDLRSNPGGFVYSVRYVLEDFLKEGQIMMSEEQNNTTPIIYKVSRPGRLQDIPLEVLVNPGTASAAEIFSTAIQDNIRGKVVGEPTVGKGVEQQVVNLSDGSILVIVFQKWLTPSGREITKEDPVHPDYILDFTSEDLKNNVDPQLNKGISLLLGK